MDGSPNTKRRIILSNPDKMSKTGSRAEAMEVNGERNPSSSEAGAARTRLLIARHAETAAPERFHGAESNVGLSAWGERQAEILGDRLSREGASVVYSSAMLRAVRTAELVAQRCGLRHALEPALHERKIGPLSGATRAEGWATYAESRARWLEGDLEYSHQGGESFADVARRVTPVLNAIAGRHQGETVIVIAHGVVIRVALISLLDRFTHADFDRIAIEFVSLSELHFDAAGWSLARLSEVVAPSDARPVA